MIPQRTIDLLEDLHMPHMVFYCNILLFVLMSYSHGLFKLTIENVYSKLIDIQRFDLLI